MGWTLVLFLAHTSQQPIALASSDQTLSSVLYGHLHMRIIDKDRDNTYFKIKIKIIFNTIMEKQWPYNFYENLL